MFTAHGRRAVGLIGVVIMLGALATAAPPADAAASAGAGGLTWRPPHMVDPYVGQMTELDCASVTSCRASDVYANVYTGHDGRWSGPRWSGVLRTLSSLTCPAPDFCAALDDDGQLVLSRGRTWTGPQRIFKEGFANEISCTSKAFCAAVGDAYQGGFLASTWDGSSWSPPVELPQLPIDLDCASPSFCAVTYFLGGAAIFDGASWGPVDPLDQIGDLEWVSCPVNGFCSAVSLDAAIVYRNGAWGEPTQLTQPGGELRSVACMPDRECFALEAGGVVHHYLQRAWQPGERIAGKVFADIDCPAVDFCLALKNGSQLYVYDGTGWQHTTDIVEYGHGITALDCPSRTLCLAVDASGASVRFDGRSWGPPTQIDGFLRLTDVSCPSALTCYTVAATGELYRYDAATGRWSAQPAAPLPVTVVTLDCPTDSFCLAVDGSGDSASFDGSAWTAQARLAEGGRAELSCATADFCAAIALKSFFRWNGTSWEDLGEQLAPSSRSISCPEVEFCMVTGEYASTRYQAGSFIISKTKLNTSSAVSCVSRTFCLTTDLEWHVAIWDGTAWSDPERIAPDNYPLGGADASCSSRQVCTVASTRGFVIRSRG